MSSENIDTPLLREIIRDGKSSLANAFLEKQAFETSSLPDSCTHLTLVATNQFNDTVRAVIDPSGPDGQSMVPIVEFLRDLQYTNGIGIIINDKASEESANIKKLLKILHIFFNNNNFWEKVYIVFTKWYSSVMTEDRASKREYVDKVRDNVRELMGDPNANPQIPYFSIDAKKDINNLNADTIDKLTALHAFLYGKEPISTKYFVKPDDHYFQVFKEVRKNFLISQTISDDEMKRTRIYADQERQKQISFDGTVSYSDWVITELRSKIDEKTKKEEIQIRVKIRETCKLIFRFERYGRRIYMLFGPRQIRQVPDHYEVTTEYEDRKRDIISDFDQNVIIGDWVRIRTYTEVQYQPLNYRELHN